MKHEPIIYYVGARDVRRVKIGTTIKLGARLSQLRAQSIDRLELLASEPGGYADERLRHELFAHVRRHGEWFEWTEEIDDWISTVTAIGHQVREENADGGYGTTEEEVRAYVFLEALGRHAHKYERAFPMERRVSALYYGCSMTYARAVERLSAAWLRDAPGDIHGALRAIRIAREMGFLVE